MERLFAILLFCVLVPCTYATDVCNCKGYAGIGGPCYAGFGGPAYAGFGGPCYAGFGGPCYAGIGGTGESCPAVCK